MASYLFFRNFFLEKRLKFFEQSKIIHINFFFKIETKNLIPLSYLAPLFSDLRSQKTRGKGIYFQIDRVYVQFAYSSLLFVY